MLKSRKHVYQEIPTNKLRKIVINAIVKCVMEKKENQFDDLWPSVANNLQVNYLFNY